MKPCPLLAVAPMMDYTDRHFRYFVRLLAPDIRLYTEMITTHALMHGDRDYLLQFNRQEKYVALQLGGADPQALAYCAQLGEEAGYDEINLNVGCPSSRVSAGRFGACLMLEPHLVAECVDAMRAKVAVPVTIKCRLGVDQQDNYQALQHFISLTAAAGCQQFIIHARKAWLHGLSPKQNREVPPLRYDVVAQIKRDFPQLNIVLNGGVKTLADIIDHLTWCDGVMIGREACANPYFLAKLQRYFYPLTQIFSREEALRQYEAYICEQKRRQLKLTTLIRPLLGLFQGQPGAAKWRRYLSENAYKPGAEVGVIQAALKLMKTE